MTMHHTRQMIVDAIQGSEYLTVRLAEGDTAWHPLMDHGTRTPMDGPAMLTYWHSPAGVVIIGYDPLAGDGDPRCDATNPAGDVCRLVAGDHLTHYWGEPDGALASALGGGEQQ